MKHILFALLGFCAWVNSTNAQGIQITTSTNSGCTPLNVVFTASAPGGYIYDWYFGDGNYLRGQTVTNTYLSSGSNYYAYVYVYGLNGNYLGSNYVNIQTLGNYKDFNISKPYVCPNESNYFSYHYSNSGVSWDFGDGSTSSSNYMYHTYTQPGYYTVRCIAQTSCGVDTIYKSVEVRTDLYPQVSFNYNANSFCPTTPINFNIPTYESSYQYSWDFGDGNYAVGGSPTHPYDSAGSYLVTLTTVNGCGNSSSVTDTVTINSNAPFPTGIMINKPSHALCQGDNFNVNTQWGYPSYTWDFGFGDIVTESASINYAINGTGNFPFNVIITNACGNDTTLLDTIVIAGTNGYFGDYAYAGVSGGASCPGTLQQIYAGSGKPVLNYEFNYGDGTPNENGTISSRYHKYNAVGVYSGSVKLTNNCGVDTLLPFTVTVSDSIRVSYAYVSPNSNTYCPNTDAEFNVGYSSGMSYITLNFGDGSPEKTYDYGTKLAHTYQDTGMYTVSCKVVNSCGFDTTVYCQVHIASSDHFLGWVPYVNQWPWEVCPNTPINYNLSMSSNYAAVVLNYGDGSPADSSIQNNFTHTFADTGIHIVSITIYDKCGNDTTYTIQSRVKLQDKINNFYPSIYPTVSCPGDAVHVNIGNGFDEAIVSFGDGDTVVYTGNDINNINHVYANLGNYLVSIKVTNGCGADTSKTLIANVNYFGTGLVGSPNIQASTPIVCPNSLIRFRTQEGYASYKWDFGDGTSYYSNNDVSYYYANPGQYVVTLTVSNNCGVNYSTTTFVTVSGQAPIEDIRLQLSSNTVCAGDMLSFHYGTSSSYELSWDFGDGSAVYTTWSTGTTHTYTTNGIYTLKVTALNGCGVQRVFLYTINVNNGAAPNLGPNSFGMAKSNGGNQSNSANEACPGDGIVFYFEGVYANNLWDFGDGEVASATNTVNTGNGVATAISHKYNNPGVYKVKLTVINNCGLSDTDSMYVTISNNGSGQVSGEMFIEAPVGDPYYSTCKPVNFIATGGASYVWYFGDGDSLVTTSNAVSHLYDSTNYYYPMVKVINGCGASQVYSNAWLFVNAGGSSSLQVLSIQYPVCAGSSTGYAALSASSGVAPYTYNWGNGYEADSVKTDLAAGTYNVLVKDANGCIGNASFVLLDGIQITAVVDSIDSASCGVADGKVVLLASGGSAPYTYSWNDGVTGNTRQNMAVGNYSVAVTSADGCSSVLNVNMSNNNSPVITGTVSGLGCYTSTDGAIEVNIQSGQAPYTYTWSNGETTEDISSLAAGTYNLTVIDNNGCSSVQSFTLEPASAEIEITGNVTNAACAQFDGSISVSVNGGTAPYTYLWLEDSTNTTSSISGIPAGSYTVEVTDANGCNTTKEIIVGNPSGPAVSLVSKSDVSCYAGSNGEIRVNASGMSPFQYMWQHNFSTNKNQTGLAAGTYTVIVRDAAQCQTISSYTVSQPVQLVAGITKTNSNCGQNNGLLVASPTGGTAPYTYSWTNGVTTQSAPNLSAGTYTLTVTDANNCTASGSSTISVQAASQSICMVTVDPATNHNIVVWEKEYGLGIAGYNIYREGNIANQYSVIASVPFSDLSEYVDVNSNTLVRSDRYKITALDSCGNESERSLIHKTMHILASPGLTPNTAMITIDPYEGFTYGSLVLYHGTDLNNLIAFDTIPSNTATYSDQNLPVAANDSVYFVVEILDEVSCTAERAKNYNHVRSNTQNLRSSSLTGLNGGIATLPVSVAPNPSKGTFEVYTFFNGKQNVKVELLDVNGRIVLQELSLNIEGHFKKRFDVGNIANGIYTLHIITDAGIATQKLIIQQ